MNIKNNLPQDLKNVGTIKALGYMPISTLEGLGVGIAETRDFAIKNNLYYKIFKHGECFVGGGAFVMADLELLQKILNANKVELVRNNWPTDAKAFVDKVITINVPQKTKLFDIIADAYADYTNHGRLSVKTTS